MYDFLITYPLLQRKEITKIYATIRKIYTYTKRIHQKNIGVFFSKNISLSFRIGVYFSYGVYFCYGGAKCKK